MVAFAGRSLTESEKSSTLDPDLNLLLRKFQLLGVASVEYKISKETCDVVSELRSANISSGIIFNKEPVAKIEIPSTEELNPPSLSVIDLPETGMNERFHTIVCLVLVA